MAPRLDTTYLGLKLASPVVASASPLTGRLETLRELAEAGAGAVVLPSLFEEELFLDGDGVDRLWTREEHAGAARAYLAPEAIDAGRLESYLDLVRDASRDLDIPVVASLNGSTPGGWTGIAPLLQGAGASALELNVYGVETDMYVSSAAVEDRLFRLVRSVRNVITMPLAVKLAPFYTALAHVASGLVEAGANGLVLFNRFYQPNVDLAALEVVPELHLSTREEIRLPLRWIAILRGRVPLSLAATTGVHTGEDVLKTILVGADVGMMASALLLHGPERVRDSIASLSLWLELHGLESVDAARGRLSQEACTNPRAFERAQYVRTLQSVDPVSSG